LVRIKANFFFIPLLVIITASAASYFADTGKSWYKTINLPSWTPSNSIVAIAWTIIFILTSLSILIIWNKYHSVRKFRIIILLFIVNAFLIVGWNILFFSHQMVGLAFIQAMLLIGNLFFLIMFIWRFSRVAAYLLLPYSAWIIFSTVLTLNIWILN